MPIVVSVVFVLAVAVCVASSASAASGSRHGCAALVAGPHVLAKPAPAPLAIGTAASGAAVELRSRPLLAMSGSPPPFVESPRWEVRARRRPSRAPPFVVRPA